MSAEFNPNQLFTCEELSDLTRISRSAIRKACCSDPGRVKISLPTITRIGTRVRFRADHVRAWLDSLSDIPSTPIENEFFGKQSEVLLKPARRPGRPRKTEVPK